MEDKMIKNVIFDLGRVLMIGILMAT
jgi:hypothetical protein